MQSLEKVEYTEYYKNVLQIYINVLHLTVINPPIIHSGSVFATMKTLKPIDFYRHVSLNIASLKLFGLWFFIPHSMTSFTFWSQLIIKIVSGVFVFIIPPIGQIAYLVKLLKSGNFQIQEIASTINLIMTEMLTSLKLLDMFARRAHLSRLIDQLVNGDFQRAGVHRNILENSIRLSRWFFVCFYIGTSLDVAVHVVVVPGLKRFQTLPVNMDLIFIDVYQPEYFNYVVIYQILYKPAVVTGYVALQTLSWCFLLFAITQLDILINNFENMKELIKAARAEGNCSENEAFKETFARCVRHHRAIIRYLDTAEAAFGGQFALSLLLNGCIICTTGVQFISIESPSKDVVNVLWVLAYLQIFILMQFCDCYFGNAVYVKSTEIADVAFRCPWLNVSPELKKDLILFMARAQKPLMMTAYNLVPVTLPTFTKVMNWTYKAFAVMNEMKK